MRIRYALRRLFGRLRPWAVRARRGTMVRCESCQEWVGVLYAMPGLVGMVEMVQLRCDGCRATWHQAIRDYYAHRAAAVAAEQHALETLPSRDEGQRSRQEAA